MKRAVGILAIALAPMFGAGAFAADDVPGAGRGGLSGTAGAAAASAQGYLGQHTMSGRVTDIDKTAGTLSIEGEGGKEMQLHFPPSALQNVNEGDQVSVQLAIKPSGASRGSTSGTGSGTGTYGTGTGTGTGTGSGGMRPGAGQGGTGAGDMGGTGTR
jgi:hypothetical protein